MGLLEELNERAANELGEKEQNIAKGSAELDAKIKTFLAELKHLKIESTHTYELKEQFEISKLKEHISKLSNKLETFDIPEKIELKTRKHVQFEDGTKKFLWLYFGLSIPILALCMYFGINGVTIERNEVKSYQNGLNDGVEIGKKSGRVEIYNALPDSSKRYLDKKFPESSFWRWN